MFCGFHFMGCFAPYMPAGRVTMHLPFAEIRREEGGVEESNGGCTNRERRKAPGKVTQRRCESH